MIINRLLSKLIARFLRAFFYLLYQPMAWSYDQVAALVSWGRWKQWVLSVLPYLEGPRILELGHGPGHLLLALQAKGLKPLGLDASRQMGQQAKKRHIKNGLEAHLVRGDAHKIPFPDRFFNQVVTTFPTEYIYTAETLNETYRILKSSGTLVVLPAAWITGKRLLDRGAAALFKVTRQAPEWDEKWLAPFSQAGFQASYEMITHESWSLVIILAQKVPNITD